MGNHVMRFESKTDLLLDLFVPDQQDSLLVKDAQENLDLLPLSKFNLAEKDSAGQRLVKLTGGDRLVTCYLSGS